MAEVVQEATQLPQQVETLSLREVPHHVSEVAGSYAVSFRLTRNVLNHVLVAGDTNLGKQ